MSPKKILLVYPEVPDTFWRMTHALKFFDKRAYSPPLGLLTVAALLPKSWERRLMDLNVTTLHPEDLEWADYVFLSAMNIQRESARKVIALCKQAGVKVVAGGPLFTNEPDEFNDVDHLVLNEAEITLPDFLSDLAHGSPKPVYSTSEFVDMTTSPLPEYGLVDENAYLLLSLQFSRGCPHQCDFCSVTALFGRRPRTKTPTQIITELENIFGLRRKGRIEFVDDNLMCDKQQLKNDLLPALIKWKRSKRGVFFSTQISMNLADDSELMDLMYQAGFRSVFIGIESPDINSLRECRKKQNIGRDLIRQIRQIQQSGIQVHGGFIIGFDQDPPDIFEQQFELIQSSGIMIPMMNLLKALPGTELYKRLEQEGRIVGPASGDNSQTNIVTRMDRETLFREYHALAHRLYSPKNYYERLKSFFRLYKSPRKGFTLSPRLALIAARCLFWLGLVRPGRFHFWRALIWTFLYKRSSLPMFFFLVPLGYHFRCVHEASAATWRAAAKMKGRKSEAVEA